MYFFINLFYIVDFFPQGCQKHPLCNDDANGNVPLGKSCNRYWQCQGGYPRLQRCPAMLVFDRRSLRCVVPPTEGKKRLKIDLTQGLKKYFILFGRL